MNFGMSGEYNIVVTKSDGTSSESGWFKNLILDQGLDRMGQNASVIRYCQVGTGTTAPAVSQAGLATFLAGSPAGPSTVYPTSLGAAGGWAQVRTFTFSFAQGAVVGNITEVGVGWADTGNALFSRALITDTNNNPVAMTLTSIDQLTIYYRITITPSLAVSSGSVTIGSTTHTYQASICAASYAYSSGYLFTIRDLYSGSNNQASGQFGASTITSLGPITTNSPWSGTSGTFTTNVAAYSLGTYYRDTTLSLGISAGNIAGGIGAISFTIDDSFYPNVQYVFTPAIQKLNTQTFAMTVRTSWARA